MGGEHHGLVISYVRGLLLGDESSIVETTVHRQVDEVNEAATLDDEVNEADTLDDEVNEAPIVTITETSYTTPSHISLPVKFKSKKAVINMVSVDEAGFKWCVTRALNPVKRNPERVTKILRKQSKQYNWDGVSFPTTLYDIDTFEKNNNIFVSVFGFDEEGGYVYLLRVSKSHGTSSVLLLLVEDESGDRAHYTMVKSLDELLNGRVLKRKCKRFYCDNCLKGFTSYKTLKSHMILCGCDTSGDDSEEYDCESYVYF